MHLLPREQVRPSTSLPQPASDRLLVIRTSSCLGFLAQKRLARGLKLNRSEAVALIAFQLQEYVRDGELDVADLMQLGKEFLGRRHVMEGVEESIHDIQIEGTFQVSLR
jgi:urease gamma subunit